MNIEESKNLLASATTAMEWKNACEQIKIAHGGYPNWWWEEIKMSGFADSVLSKFGATTEIKILSGEELDAYFSRGAK